jgi:hypothetical protein
MFAFVLMKRGQTDNEKRPDIGCVPVTISNNVVQLLPGNMTPGLWHSWLLVVRKSAAICQRHHLCHTLSLVDGR